MRTFLDAVCVGLLFGFAFGFGKDLWGWIACKFFPKFRADRTIITVDVDAEEAMKTLEKLRESLEAVDKAAASALNKP